MTIQSLKDAKVILLACGSFNPPTMIHLRMFEAARDFLRIRFGCDVVEGIISPVADQFGKAELVSAEHRLRMCQAAVQTSSWIRADGWECQQKQWNYTLSILEHHRQEFEKKYNSDFRLMLLCGADLVDTFSRIKSNGEPLWKFDHLRIILKNYGIIALQRHAATPHETLTSLSLPRELDANLLVVDDDTFPNQLSSTRLRKALREGRSIRYCAPDSVVDYIAEHRLYAAPNVTN